MWGKLKNLNVENKEKFIKILRGHIEKAKNGEYDFIPGEKEFNQYIIINEKINNKNI